MKTRTFWIIYLIGAVITFGDIGSSPRWLDKNTPEEEKLMTLGLCYGCACWPLFWSVRIFHWIKKPTVEGRAA